jgi:hypothetical protein
MGSKASRPKGPDSAYAPGGGEEKPPLGHLYLIQDRVRVWHLFYCSGSYPDIAGEFSRRDVVVFDRDVPSGGSKSILPTTHHA